VTAGERTRPAPPSTLRIAAARARLELRLFSRDPAQVIFSFAYPILMMLIFAAVFRNDTVAGGVTYTQYFLSGIAATGIMLSSFQALGIRIALERDEGELARLQALGTPAVSYFLGKAAQVLVTASLQLAGLLLVARFAFDVAMPIDAAHWFAFGWVAVLGALAGTVLGIAVSLLPHKGRSADTMIATIALVLQFFSGVFFVYSRLPTWMRDIAAVFPLKWLTQGMRSAFLPDRAASAEVSGSWQHDWTAAVLLAWIVIGVIVCARSFRWRRSA
jgi:ABC-2 type transport system permease protein